MKAQGMTLLEVLLALAIISSIILFAARQYQTYQNEEYAMQLRYSADAVLEALGYYYQANCDHGTLAPGARGGTLTTFPPSPPVQIVRLATDLRGYFPANLRLANPLIDMSAGVDQGYFAQYNFFQQTPGRNTNVCYSFWNTGGGTSPAPSACSNTPQAINTTTIVGWQIQLAVKMLDPLLTTHYLGLTGADCATNALPTDGPVDCTQSTSGAPLNYLVWQRTPSFASSEINSDLWLSMPTAKQFNLQYTNDPMLEMNVSGTTYYYLCGG